MVEGKKNFTSTPAARRPATVSRVLFLLCIVLSLVALACGCGRKQEKAKTEKIVNVRVWPVEKRTVRPFLESVGDLRPFDEVTVSSELDGILKTIPVNEGAPVSKEMVLATINDTDFRLNLDNARSALKQAEASLTNTTSEYQRKETLLKEDLVTKQQFDDVATRLTIAGHDLDRAKTAFSLAQEKLSKTIIRSPLKGVVKEKKASVGDFAKTGSPLLTIIQIDPLKLAFNVAEKDVGALKVGQDVTFTVDSFPGKEFKGKLVIIYPQVDERSRTLQVEARVANPDLQLKPGLFSRVILFTSRPKEAIVIPITAILYDGDKTKVFLLQGDQATERIVKIGEKYGEMLEVVEGLQTGEPLIVVGQNNLVQGVKVNVVP
jgi:membrane fusion protein (multidrug efflux system)